MLGLSRLLLKTQDIHQISDMALKGTLTNIDLQIQDICNRPLSSLNSPIQDFVLIGNLTQLPQCKEIFPKLEEMYGARFLIPKYSEYRTAIGAALTYINGSTVHPVR